MLSSQILLIIIAILSFGILILLYILYKKSKFETGLNRKIKILERSSEYSEDGLLVITKSQELITFNEMAKQLFLLYNKELAKAVILKMSDGKMESINSLIKANRERLEHFKSFSVEATLLKKRKEIAVRISFEAYFISKII